VARAAFLLLIVWWAWIYTTWMANWFDPASSAVRAVLTAVMLASLLMAAALPEAFGARGLLFAASYVALQVGRNVAAAPGGQAATLDATATQTAGDVLRCVKLWSWHTRVRSWRGATGSG
jgi:low temperature requirement protein LtrA